MRRIFKFTAKTLLREPMWRCLPSRFLSLREGSPHCCRSGVERGGGGHRGPRQRFSRFSTLTQTLLAVFGANPCAAVLRCTVCQRDSLNMEHGQDRTALATASAAPPPARRVPRVPFSSSQTLRSRTTVVARRVRDYLGRLHRARSSTTRTRSFSVLEMKLVCVTTRIGGARRRTPIEVD